MSGSGLSCTIAAAPAGQAEQMSADLLHSAAYHGQNGDLTVKRKYAKKARKGRKAAEHSVRYFWGGVFLVGLFAVLLMYVALV